MSCCASNFSGDVSRLSGRAAAASSSSSSRRRLSASSAVRSRVGLERRSPPPSRARRGDQRLALPAVCGGAVRLFTRGLRVPTRRRLHRWRFRHIRAVLRQRAPAESFVCIASKRRESGRQAGNTLLDRLLSRACMARVLLPSSLAAKGFCQRYSIYRIYTGVDLQLALVTYTAIPPMEQDAIMRPHTPL